MASRRIDRSPIIIQQDALRLRGVSPKAQVMTDCPQCYAYHHEIVRLQAQLRRLRADAIPKTPITPLTTSLGLTGQQEAIVELLWAAKGNAVLPRTLLIALGAGSTKESLRVQLCRIRDKLGADSIANKYGAGYYLTAKGLGKLGVLMEQTK